ncbi:MAG: type II secretion system protein [Verrucomicrobia bacterium]|nr:type II secretion system protein [Verrucomicrobiota bacterium]
MNFKKIKNKTCRFFTLLEMMIGLSILIMAAGAISWKLHGAIVKKRFDSGASRIKLQLQSTYRLAFNTRSDWKVVFEQTEGTLKVMAVCMNTKSFPNLHPKTVSLEKFQILFKDKPIENLVIYFSPTGKVFPEGRITLIHDEFEEELNLQGLLLRYEGKEKGGPLHPDDIPDLEAKG